MRALFPHAALVIRTALAHERAETANFFRNAALVPMTYRDGRYW